jgi:hypothetical protein
LKTLGL